MSGLGTFYIPKYAIKTAGDSLYVYIACRKICQQYYKNGEDFVIIVYNK